MSNLSDADSTGTPGAPILRVAGAGPQTEAGSEDLILMAEMAQALTWGRDEAEVVTELQSGSPAAFDAIRDSGLKPAGEKN